MASLLNRIQRVEHTGDNRCWPCTYTNLALLSLFTIAVAVVSTLGAVVIALVGCLGIWLRGYLVPFTPRFAPQIVRHLPWDPFHNKQKSDSITPVDDTGGQAVLEELTEVGAVQGTAEDVKLDRSFETSWHAEMDRLTSLSDKRLAKETVFVSPSATDWSIHSVEDNTYIVLSDGSGSLSGESWVRRPVAIAETAGALTLREWGVSSDRSAAGARALGLFLRTCPECGGTVTERPADGCCGPPETGQDGEVLHARICDACEVRYHVFE